MSDVTSNSYPVITVSKSGDQFLVVQNGQLKKLTRAGLSAFIDGLAPDTLLELTDTPASYVGQQGKALVVGPGEEGMVFEATTAGNFLALSDTPNAYGGQSRKVARVNSAETAIEFVDDTFLAHTDTPVSYAGSSQFLVRVNTGASALEFISAASAQTTGWAQYMDGTYTAGSPFVVTAGTTVDLPNDAASIIDAQLPDDVAEFYDGTVITTGGDGDFLNVSIRFTTESSVNEGSIRVALDIGGVPGEIVSDFRRLVRGIGVANQCTIEFDVYTGSTFFANGATVKFEAISGNQSVYNINYAISRTHKAK